MKNDLRSVLPVKALKLSNIDWLVFSGGGNRCWWQAGVISGLLKSNWALPSRLTGTSAGASIAAAFLTSTTQNALAACLYLYGNTQKIFSWSLRSVRSPQFAHKKIYPAWVSSIITDETFQIAKHSLTQLDIAITRPSRWLGLTGSIFAGTAAYLIDKKVSNTLHPRLPLYMGLKQEFVSLNGCSSFSEAHTLLCAAAAAPPFMPARLVSGGHAIDGGYVDNAPVPAQTLKERQKTLVLLTRHYPRLPRLFEFQNRCYFQPGQKIPVSTWDCTHKATVLDAFNLGSLDVQNMLKQRDFLIT